MVHTCTPLNLRSACTRPLNPTTQNPTTHPSCPHLDSLRMVRIAESNINCNKTVLRDSTTSTATPHPTTSAATAATDRGVQYSILHQQVDCSKVHSIKSRQCDWPLFILLLLVPGACHSATHVGIHCITPTWKYIELLKYIEVHPCGNTLQYTHAEVP